MIDVFSGEFLFHPAAIEISGNTCSHNCFYCFANARKQARYMELQPTINRLKKDTDRTLLDSLLKEGFPICFSNRTDPFSQNNHVQTLSLAPYLFKRKNGIFIQTKGGYGIEEFIELSKRFNKKNMMFYITITALRDEISKSIEPNAPATSERLELIKYLKSEGFNIIAAYNPLTEDWLPFDDMKILTDKLISLGVNNIIVEALHFNPMDLKSLPESKAKHLTDNMLSDMKIYYMRDKTKRAEAQFNRYQWKVIEYLSSMGVNTFKLGMPKNTELFNDIRNSLGLIFPNQWDVINWCYKQDYKDGLVVTYDDYLKEITKYNPDFYQKEFKHLSNNYILKIAFKVWKGSYKVQNANTFEKIFNIYWNEYGVKASLQRNYLFRLIVDSEGKAIKDSKGNVQLYFDGNIHAYERQICLT